MGYEIQPAGLSAVLSAVQTQMTEMADGIDGRAIETAVTGIGDAPAPGVLQAVAEFLDRESPAIESIGVRVKACLLGASTVGNTYLTATDQMLQNVQTQAIASASSGDFSFFGES